MKTYKVNIKRLATQTHLIGCLVVMAENEHEALKLCSNEINTNTEVFESPIEYSAGVVFKTEKSAWDRYQ